MNYTSWQSRNVRFRCFCDLWLLLALFCVYFMYRSHCPLYLWFCFIFICRAITQALLWDFVLFHINRACWYIVRPMQCFHCCETNDKWWLLLFGWPTSLQLADDLCISLCQPTLAISITRISEDEQIRMLAVANSRQQRCDSDRDRWPTDRRIDRTALIDECCAFARLTVHRVSEQTLTFLQSQFRPYRMLNSSQNVHCRV